MTDFLQLVKDTARESGTIPAYASITSVSGQSGRVALFVEWVRQSYRDIQNERNDWQWLVGEFEGTALEATDTFASTDLNIDVDRFSHWILPNNGLEYVTCYPTADGVSEEAFLIEFDYQTFKRRFKMGSEFAVTGRPSHFAINPQDKIVLYPTPNADHVIKGSYYKGPQTLSTDKEQPEMPRRFHEAIMWGALVYMCTHDEAFEQIQIFQSRYDAVKKMMVLRNTPNLELGGPLA